MQFNAETLLNVGKTFLMLFPGIITEHGIGLENVREMAEWYFGGVNIKVEGDVFHVTVMLQQVGGGGGKE